MPLPISPQRHLHRAKIISLLDASARQLMQEMNQRTRKWRLSGVTGALNPVKPGHLAPSAQCRAGRTNKPNATTHASAQIVPRFPVHAVPSRTALSAPGSQIFVVGSVPSSVVRGLAVPFPRQPPPSTHFLIGGVDRCHPLPLCSHPRRPRRKPHLTHVTHLNHVTLSSRLRPPRANQ